MLKHHKLGARVAAVALLVGVVAPVTASVVGVGAASASGSQMSCAKLSGNATTTSIKDCSGPGSLVTKAGKGSGTTTITCTSCGGWNVETTTTFGKGTAGGTDTSGANYTESGPGKGTPCGAKAITIVETGSVLSGTGAASILTGDTTTATVCYNTSKNTIKNAKGTTVDS